MWRAEVDGRTHERNPLAGAAAGAIGGLLGSWLMVVVQHAMGGNGRGSHPGDTHPQRRRDALPNDVDGTYSDEPATMQAASMIAETVAGETLTERQKQIGGSVLHYAFGAVMGAMYGAAAEKERSTTAGFGLPFGAGVWLAADEAGVAMGGFATHPADYPLSRHVAALASHLVYGATVEGVRRLLRTRR
jgi:putative membrane protein